MRKTMVETQGSQLSVRAQCELLDVNRNRLAPPPPKVSEEDLRIMRVIDELHLKHPAYGARRLSVVLQRDHGFQADRKRTARLMKIMGVVPRWPQPRTSQPGAGHKTYPYLLREVKVTAPDQAWCADITYIPMARGCCYACVVMDWHSRKALGWAVSTTMDTGLCLEAFAMALRTAGRAPDIMNTDQGSQFTGERWIQEMLSHSGLRISMDGKGRWVDNVFIERLWWSLKYEDIYLKAYETPRAVERGVSAFLRDYNSYRPHQTLGDRTPDAVYAERTRPEAA